MEAPVRQQRHRRGPAALLVLIFAAAAPQPPAAAQDTELTPIVVALPEGPSARTIGYYLAKAGGWFAREGLDPTFVIADKRAPSAMLATGDADLAVDIMPRALKVRADGADILHVAQIFQKSGLVLACRKPIKEPKDLRGMNISLWSGGREGAFYAWMAKVGLGIYGEADGVTILREGLDPDAYRQRASDCFTGQSYALPAQLGLHGKTTFDYRVFFYEQVGTAILEDGVYVRAKDLKYSDRVERIAHFLAAVRAGWRNAAHEARKAAEFLVEIVPPPVPELATLLRSIWAANDLVQVDRIPFGRLDPAAYDRTVTILLTAAPDPLLKTAPRGATSDAAVKALEALD
ncbi:ABC transporter substrate-binding protein [Dongia deserti]|uniref:ABC transporter substrate-binding protein n=1 Tax=Dongia deserti TaxID=2268030 RepID=UPI0013C44D9E|nr:ABC transporter substrate-binding protein [Dongia deserti]